MFFVIIIVITGRDNHHGDNCDYSVSLPTSSLIFIFVTVNKSRQYCDDNAHSLVTLSRLTHSESADMGFPQEAGGLYGPVDGSQSDFGEDWEWLE